MISDNITKFFSFFLLTVCWIIPTEKLICYKYIYCSVNSQIDTPVKLALRSRNRAWYILKFLCIYFWIVYSFIQKMFWGVGYCVLNIVLSIRMTSQWRTKVDSWGDKRQTITQINVWLQTGMYTEGTHTLLWKTV